MAVLMDEDQAPEAVAETDSRPRGTRRRYIGRTAKWLVGILAAIVLLIAAAAVVLNTPVGERFLADRIAARTLPNGLNIRIGRIEGDLYGRARLYDVVLSDPTGPFMTIPEAELDWNPGAWLRNTLDIDEFAARRATLTTADINGMCCGGGDRAHCACRTALARVLCKSMRAGKKRRASPRGGGAGRDAMA